jgi:hypothetical protein
MFDPALVVFAVMFLAAIALPFVVRTPKHFRTAGVLLSLAGVELTFAARLGSGGTALGLALLSFGIVFAKRAWTDYSEQAIIARGEAAIARAEGKR